MILIFGGLLKITWSISKTGVDIMEFFGNAGRPGTAREQGRTQPRKENPTKWKQDGSKV